MWDDWGGWFDPVKPRFEDYDGLGFRVPLLIVSPYAKHDTSRTSTTKRRASCASSKTTSDLPQLAASDARANDPAADPAPSTTTSRRGRSKGSRREALIVLASVRSAARAARAKPKTIAATIKHFVVAASARTY